MKGLKKSSSECLVFHGDFSEVRLFFRILPVILLLLNCSTSVRIRASLDVSESIVVEFIAAVTVFVSIKYFHEK